MTPDSSQTIRRRPSSRSADALRDGLFTLTQTNTWRQLDERRGGQNSSPQLREASLGRYNELLEHEAHLADVPADLLKAICWHASGWRQFEPSGRVLTTPTPHGTLYGAMQLNDVWHPDAFPAATSDVEENIRYAARLLSWLHDQTGDWRRTTIAFFGHDRRAEVSARRIARYLVSKPWTEREELASTRIVREEVVASVVQLFGRQGDEPLGPKAENFPRRPGAWHRRTRETHSYPTSQRRAYRRKRKSRP